LTINNSTSGTTEVTACDSYTWNSDLGNGLTYTESTIVSFETENAQGCTHTETLELTINNSTSGTTQVTACDSYTWDGPLGNGETYTSSISGITFESTNAQGCTHTETLNLTINSSTSNATDITACDSYTWAVEDGGNGLTYEVSGSYEVVSENAQGCEHTETLNLTINSSTSNATDITACDSYTWAVEDGGNGLTYEVSGSYEVVSENAQGCEHTEILNLTISNQTSGTTEITACESYTWDAASGGNGETYTASGSYEVVSENAQGCTHTETLVLTITNSTTGTTEVTACESYVWEGPLGNGETYTAQLAIS
jgi:hypothetical protein